MSILKKMWDLLVEWGEEIHEYRRKNNLQRMY